MRRYPGVVVGIVENVSDPKGEGRVQVSFPWLPDVREYPWASIAAPLAGKGRGAFFMPEQQDEVLIAFEQGDFEHPFIVGFLWNGVDQPPETDHQNRVILTPGGHTLRFEDGDNTKKVVIKSNGGHEIVLDDTTAGQTITLKTKGNQRIVLDDEKESIQLKGGGRILALHKGKVEIS